MSRKVDLYDSAYGNYESATYRQVRIETYGIGFPLPVEIGSGGAVLFLYL